MSLVPEVPAHAMVFLAVTDHRLDGGLQEGGRDCGPSSSSFPWQLLVVAPWLRIMGPYALVADHRACLYQFKVDETHHKTLTGLDGYMISCCTSCSQFASQAVLKAFFHLLEGVLLQDTISEPLLSWIEASALTKAV